MEIDIPDLDDLEFIKACNGCGGVKTIPAWRLGVSHPKYVSYTKKGHNEEIECPYCEGSGKMLTEVGKRLLSFLNSLGIDMMEEGWKTK